MKEKKYGIILYEDGTEGFETITDRTVTGISWAWDIDYENNVIGKMFSIRNLNEGYLVNLKNQKDNEEIQDNDIIKYRVKKILETEKFE